MQNTEQRKTMSAGRVSSWRQAFIVANLTAATDERPEKIAAIFGAQFLKLTGSG